MTISDQRAAFVARHIQASADELVMRGAIGVAARIVLPGRDEPLVLAAGQADPEHGTPMRGDELFAIASQSKMFTAALVLLLARKGMVSLGDPIERYLDDVPAIDPGATIDQLLNHSSGIGNFIHAITTLPAPWPSLRDDDLLAMARLQGRQFAPGERLDYNNTDVVVLARLCETLTGRTRADLVRDWLTGPLGMDDTLVGLGDAPRRARMAKGYYRPVNAPDGRPIDVSTVNDFSIAGAAGDMTSSLADMTRWLAALSGPNPTGLTLADFLGNRIDSGAAGGPWFMPRTYARGVESWLWGGREVWGHRGSFFGYHSGSFVEPASGAIMAMVLTMTTEGQFMGFIDSQAHGYMRFMGEALAMAVQAAEMP